MKFGENVNVGKKNFCLKGREILIKAMALAIPIYSMSYFILPKFLCAELESMMARFWWG